MSGVIYFIIFRYLFKMRNIVKKIISEQILLENRKQKVIDYWIHDLEKSGSNLKYRYSDETIKTVVDYVSTQDPSGGSKYLEWLTKQIFGNQTSMFDTRMYDTVTEYNKNLNRITPDFLVYLKNKALMLKLLFQNLKRLLVVMVLEVNGVLRLEKIMHLNITQNLIF